jgi:hypothetical protein
MINERGRRIWRRIGRGRASARRHEFERNFAMSGIMGFFIAVGVASAVFFMLMMRADRIRDRRRAYADPSTADSGGILSGNDGFSLLNWFGRSSSSSSSDDSCSSSSSFLGSSDSSCSDGGGGGGDGGGD